MLGPNGKPLDLPSMTLTTQRDGAEAPPFFGHKRRARRWQYGVDARHTAAHRAAD